MKKMRIAQLVPSLKPTGLVRVSLDLSAILRSMGHEVEVFYFDQLEGAVELEYATQITKVSRNNFETFDVLHTHGFRPDMYVRRNYKTIVPPCVSTLHNYVYDDLKYQYGKLVAWVFSKVWNWGCVKHKACAVLSEDMKRYYQGFWRNKNLNVIHNTRYFEPVNPDQNLVDTIKLFAKERVILGSMSIINPRKGLSQIIELLKLNETYCWVHFGEGESKDDLVKELEKSGVKDRVLLAGYNRNAKAYAFLFDVLLVPSHSEGFPLTLLEGVQLNIPTVTSDIPVFKEVFKEDEVARFKLGDIHDFERAVQRTLKANGAMTKKAYQRFVSEYSPEAIGGKYMQLYESVQ